MQQLDQIFIDEALITAQQRDDAQESVRLRGGRVEDHLLRLGYVDRPTLLSTLARLHDCESVDLSATEISPAARDILPAETARRLKVLPFNLDPDRNVLQVAVAAPPDEHARREIETLAGQRRVEFFITLSSTLECTLIENYRTTVLDSDIAFPAATTPIFRGSVLLVTTLPDADRHLACALGAENYKVVIVDSISEALSEIDAERFESVLIRGSRSERYRPLMDRCRVLWPSTEVRFFSDVCELTGGSVESPSPADLLAANLRLCIGLLSSEEELDSGQSGRVGRYVDRVCRELRLPAVDRMVIANAAYVSEIARLYLGEADTQDWATAFGDADGEEGGGLSFPTPVLAVLQAAAGEDLPEYPDRVSRETLGGNIINLVKEFCRIHPASSEILLHEFEMIAWDLRAAIGSRFIADAVEALLTVLWTEVVNRDRQTEAYRVLLYNPVGHDVLMLGPCLENIGFEIQTAGSLERLAEIYRVCPPDITVLIAPGSADRAAELATDVLSLEVAIDQVPTFLLPESVAAEELHYLLMAGLEDIIPIDSDLDPLLVKLTRIRARREAERKSHLKLLQNVGTHGVLGDMNVIDLLQAMGHSEKSIRISITAQGMQTTILLNEGRLHWAECDDLMGAEAIYASLAWKDGVWCVDPILPGDLPTEPNVQESIDAILIEGCRLLDEGTRNGGKEASTVSDADTSLDSLFES